MWRSIGAAVPGLLVMVIILGGISPGIFTATESASVAVIYSILLTFFLYRTMTWDNFLQAAAKASKTTGVVLLLIGVSTMFQYLMGALLGGRPRRRGDGQRLDQSLGRSSS